MHLDSELCYRSLNARDSRFDGQFFVGVTSTGIYCRPICPTRVPRRDNCLFFANAASAERDGYRPCLRCRPELAPGKAPMDAVGRVAAAAVARIEAGALNDAGFDALASEMGLSGRQLRRSIEREYGVAPVELAQTRRLLLAKQLLTETTNQDFRRGGVRQRLFQPAPLQSPVSHPLPAQPDSTWCAASQPRQRPAAM